MAPRNFKALIRTGTVTIQDGPDSGPDKVEPVVIRYRKRGALNVADKVATVPLLADAIEAATNKGLSAKTAKGATLETIREAVATAAEENGVPIGRAIRDLVTNLPRIIRDILTEDTVLEEGESRDDLREWYSSLGPTALCDAVIGWVELNLPEFRGPLVAFLVRALTAGQQFARSLAAAAPVEAAAETAVVVEPAPAAAA